MEESFEVRFEPARDLDDVKCVKVFPILSYEV